MKNGCYENMILFYGGFWKVWFSFSQNQRKEMSELTAKVAE